jgi:hypothetical protein
MIAIPAASIRNVRERELAACVPYAPPKRREIAAQLTILFFTILTPPFW